jgi:hypothetical protein
MWFKRILGIVLLLVGLSGLVLAVTGMVYSNRAVGAVAQALMTNLELTSRTLGAAEQTLLLAQGSVEQLSIGLATVQDAATQVSQTISETEPLLGAIGHLVGGDVPDSLEAVQAGLPAMAETAAIVEQTLVTLSDLRLEQRVLGIPLRFDLGIRYAPETTMVASIEQMSEVLTDIPERLRDLEPYLETAGRGLSTIGQDVGTMSTDLGKLTRTLAGMEPLLDEYLQTVTEAKSLIEATQRMLVSQLNNIKLVVTVGLVWLALAQLVPLYLGWALLTTRRGQE